MGSHLAQDAGGHTSSTEDVRDARTGAARKRLRECEDQQDACEAIREIVSNLLGCEEMALFQLERDHWRFPLIWSFGIEQKAVQLSKLLRGSALADVIAGQAHISESSGQTGIAGKGEKARAFVPIQFDGRTAAVLVLLRLLPQKAKIDELDRELFAVISREAGKGLFGGLPGSTGRSERKR